MQTNMLRGLRTTYEVDEGVDQPAALLPAKRLPVALDLAAVILAAALNVVLALTETLR